MTVLKVSTDPRALSWKKKKKSRESFFIDVVCRYTFGYSVESASNNTLKIRRQDEFCLSNAKDNMQRDIHKDVELCLDCSHFR
jgi:hypothetical protein